MGFVQSRKYRNPAPTAIKAFRFTLTFEIGQRYEMSWIIAKYLLTAAIVVAVSEFAKRSDKLGALVAALPLITVLTLIWLHIEGPSATKVANHARYTFWYVLPTLPMFLAFPVMHSRLGFWPALAIGIAITALCFLMFAYVLRHFGIDLM